VYLPHFEFIFEFIFILFSVYSFVLFSWVRNKEDASYVVEKTAKAERSNEVFIEQYITRAGNGFRLASV